jgi:thioredoxin reductase
MQRRNFISNLAVILPAGMVAPKLLFEDQPTTTNLIKAEVLVLGAGNAGLFIAQKLRKAKIETVLLEPGTGTSDAAVYNHHQQAGIIRQHEKNSKAEVITISADRLTTISETVAAGFVPKEIRKTSDGYFVSDGKTTYQAQKLVLALPVEMDLAAATVKVNLAQQDSSLLISCKRKNQRNPATIRTISAAKIDEAIVLQFGHQQSQGLLAVL